MTNAISLGALLKGNDDPIDSAVGRRAAKDAILQFFKVVAARDTAALAQSIFEEAVYEIPFSESGSTEAGGFRRYVGTTEVVDSGRHERSKEPWR
jgi:hypothetical protein